MTSNPLSDKSISLSGLNRQYRALKKVFFSQATNKDLTNLMVLLGANGEISPQIRNLLTVLSVSAITEELSDRKRKGKFDAAIPKRTIPIRPDIVVSNDDADGGTTVHGEGDL